MSNENSANEPRSPAPTDRVIRVFISSTFRDMMKERDLLVKEVFPELRRKCAKRFVTFTEVDLRWGMTTEQTAQTDAVVWRNFTALSFASSVC